ncbi:MULTISPECIES: GGDEF domain-containing protein [Pseudoalteromonas]|uniref:GGDEF domain-containing protein n=1 Tax=Pseudoalteromonas TaxID=53246 RepID=UPI00036ABF25|nr:MULTISPECIES: GGDEF domain-containing protein [Pseudoalteromonas]MCF6142747.1 hypothetical protein [Pseudoalteromonas mariniglutinosa NCIMB 1770]
MMHLPTIIILSIILNTLIGSFLLSLYRLKKQKTYLYWCCSCFIFVLAQVTASLRAYSDLNLISHYLADLLIIIAPLAAILGIHAYNNTEKSKFTACISVLLVSVITLMPFYSTSFAQLYTTLVIACSFCYAAYALNKLHVGRVSHFLLLQICFVIHALLMFCQAALLVSAPTSVIDTQQALAVILISHIVISTCTALVWPVLMFLESEQVLTDLANLDPLTGLLNRRAFLNLSATHLEQANSYQKELCALMIDIDFFKKVNDQFGHETGDEALKWVATKIQAQLREHDIVARIGGEEFAILLPNTSEKNAQALSERIRLAIKNQPFIYKQHSISLSLSIGVIKRTGDSNINDLLAKADKGLYQAKHNGRNQVVVAI